MNLDKQELEQALKTKLNNTVTIKPVVYVTKNDFLLDNNIAYIGTFNNANSIDTIDSIHGKNANISTNETVIFTDIKNDNFQCFTGYVIHSEIALY